MAEWIDKGEYETCIVARETDLGQEGVEIQLARIKAGKDFHYHAKKTESFYFTAGQGKVIMDGEERIVGPGDFIVIKPNVNHAVMNDGKIPLEMLMVKTNNSLEDTYKS